MKVQLLYVILTSVSAVARSGLRLLPYRAGRQDRPTLDLPMARELAVHLNLERRYESGEP